MLFLRRSGLRLRIGMVPVLLLCYTLYLQAGCAETATGPAEPIARVGDALDAMQVQQSGLLNAAARIEASLVKVEANVQTNLVATTSLHSTVTSTIGGGGDSVTSWIYALLAFVLLVGTAAAMLYPLVIRPRRLLAQARERGFMDVGINADTNGGTPETH